MWRTLRSYRTIVARACRSGLNTRRRRSGQRGVELQGNVLRVWCDKCIRKIDRDGNDLQYQLDPGLYVSHIAYSPIALRPNIGPPDGRFLRRQPHLGLSCKHHLMPTQKRPGHPDMRRM